MSQIGEQTASISNYLVMSKSIAIEVRFSNYRLDQIQPEKHTLRRNDELSLWANTDCMIMKLKKLSRTINF